MGNCCLCFKSKNNSKSENISDNPKGDKVRFKEREGQSEKQRMNSNKKIQQIFMKCNRRRIRKVEIQSRHSSGLKTNRQDSQIKYEVNGEKQMQLQNSEPQYQEKTSKRLSTRVKRSGLQDSLVQQETPQKLNQGSMMISKSNLDNSANKQDTDVLVETAEFGGAASARKTTAGAQSRAGESDSKNKRKKPLSFPRIPELERMIGEEQVNSIQKDIKEIASVKNVQERKQLERSKLDEMNKDIAARNCVLQTTWAVNYMNSLNNSTEFNDEIENESFSKKEDAELGELWDSNNLILVTNKVFYFLYSLYGGGPFKLYNPELPTKKFSIKPIGLKNHSNYCYMNSCIQSMFSIGELNTYFEEKRYERYLQKNTKKSQKFTIAYSDMLKSFLKAGRGRQQPVSASEFQMESRDIFDPSEQHDAQEYLRYVLGEIQDELSLTASAQKSTQNSGFQNSQAAMENYFSENSSVIDQLFCGQLISSITCTQCKQPSFTYEPFLDLSLPIDLESIKTIEQAIEAFFKPEKIEGTITCDKCNKQSKILRKLEIGKIPQYLVLHFKRFKMFPTRQKLKTIISYPEQLSIKKFMKDKKEVNTTYRLISVIVHWGNVESGHYVSFNLRDNQWYLCDDDSIKECNIDDVLGQEAYLLFYEKMQ